MAWEGFGGIVLSGGWGSLNAGRSKMIEKVEVDGRRKPMVKAVFDLLSDRLDIFPIAVVDNNYFVTDGMGNYGYRKDGQIYHVSGSGERCLSMKNESCYTGQIRNLFTNYTDDLFITQIDRFGTAGAVELCYPILDGMGKSWGNEVEDIIVLYGDMPFISASSLMRLVLAHKRSSEQNVMTMFSVKLDEATPECVKKFGRIGRDRRGRIIAIGEPFELDNVELARATHVNPSVWIFKKYFLKREIQKLPWHDKSDNHHRERILPDLVGTVRWCKGETITEIPLANPMEVVGINDMNDYNCYYQGIKKVEYAA